MTASVAAIHHTPGLSCWVLGSERELEAMAPQWDALLGRSDNDQPVLSPLWLLAWWRVFGASEGRRLRVCCFLDGDRLVGLAPLLARRYWYRPGIPFRRLELLASGEREADEIGSDYIGIIAERGAEASVARALADALATGRLGDFDELVLPAMDGETTLPSRLADALRAIGLDARLTPSGASPLILLPARWEQYLTALPSSGRYLVSRSLRDFDRWAGPDVRIRRAETPDDLAEGKRVLIQLHGERWEAKDRDGVFASPLFRSFHDAVLPALLSRGALDLRWLCVREKPIAVQYNIVWRDRVHFYQGGRAVDVPKSIRPGIVLHAHAIRAAIEAGHREYDFLGGASRYKLQLALRTRPLVTLRAARPGLRETLRHLRDRGAAWARGNVEPAAAR